MSNQSEVQANQDRVKGTIDAQFDMLDCAINAMLVSSCTHAQREGQLLMLIILGQVARARLHKANNPVSSDSRYDIPF
jgi:hypothetical protein